MNNSAVPYWLAFAVVLAALYGGFKWYQVEQSRSAGDALLMVDLPPLEEFELTTQAGKPFRSRAMRGKVWVVSFFFSTCPGSCSRLNANIKYLSSLPEIKDATWVSITVDPVADTQAVLAAKAKELNADPERWLFCRSDDFDYIKRIAHDMLKVGGVSYKGHNDFAVVVGKDGSIAGYFNAISTQQSEKGVKLIEKCLAAPWSDPSQSAGRAEQASEEGNMPGAAPLPAEAA